MSEPIENPNAREVFCNHCRTWSDRGAWGTTQLAPAGVSDPDWAAIGDPFTHDRLDAEVAAALHTAIVCPACGGVLDVTERAPEERGITLTRGGALPEVLS